MSVGLYVYPYNFISLYVCPLVGSFVDPCQYCISSLVGLWLVYMLIHVNLSVCMSVNWMVYNFSLSIYLCVAWFIWFSGSIYLFGCLCFGWFIWFTISIYLFLRPWVGSIRLIYMDLHIDLSVCMSAFLLIYVLYVNLVVSMSVSCSIYLFLRFNLSLYLSVCLMVYMIINVDLSVCLSLCFLVTPLPPCGRFFSLKKQNQKYLESLDITRKLIR